MKYLVMECNESCAVLMDEESRFVTAANLGYEVGQTVTEPVLMPYESNEVRRRRGIVLRLAAAAACLTLMCFGGYYYYSVNYKTYSTVIISSSAGVKMDVNKKGKVIRLESTSPEGEELLSEYSGKGKSMNDAISELVEMSVSKGYISGGDTVAVYSSDDGSKRDSMKKDLDKELAALSINTDVQPIDDYNGQPAKATEPVTPPTEPSEPASVSEPAIAPPVPPEREEPSLPEPPVPPTAPQQPEEPPAPPEPPTKAEIDEPEPPTPPTPPTEKLPGEERPADHLGSGHEHPDEHTDPGKDKLPGEHHRNDVQRPGPELPKP